MMRGILFGFIALLLDVGAVPVAHAEQVAAVKFSVPVKITNAKFGSFQVWCEIQNKGLDNTDQKNANAKSSPIKLINGAFAGNVEVTVSSSQSMWHQLSGDYACRLLIDGNSIPNLACGESAKVTNPLCAKSSKSSIKAKLTPI
jgi:hypothetical protein